MFYPFITEGQKKAVAKTLNTRWVGQGPQCDEFETKFSAKFNIPYSVSVNSGSAALETACDLLELKSGDKVIVTPLTCTATNLPLVRRGCELLWADIDPETLCMSQESVDKLLVEFPDVKAIFNVHLGGIESNIKVPSEVAFTVDDACQAIGIYREDATFTCYSFQAIKSLTTGDGGMFCCKTEKGQKNSKLLRWFGIDREKKREANWKPYMGREMTFDIELIGHKRQMNDIAASMGIEGLKAYDSILKKRKAIFKVYQSIKCEGFKLIDPKNVRNVYWTAAAIVDNRDAFAEKLSQAGIETNLVQVRNDCYKVFGGKRQDLPVMNELESKYIYIPLNSHMSLEDAKYIKQIIEEGW